MNNDAIGVFDSGIGGLTTVKELNALLPNENIIYFGDTARIPYGTRSKETIVKYTNQAINFLRNHKVKMIIIACGTASSVLSACDPVTEIPFTGVVLPAVQAACGATRKARIGIIGTTATIKSGSYGKAIRTIRADSFVVGNPCPLLVPLAENGYTARDNPVSKLVLKQYLAPILAENVDTLILGCTHYPLFEEAIADIVGEGVTLISAGREAAKHAGAILTEKEQLAEPNEETKGENTFYVSDSVELFAENARQFLGHKVDGEVHRVDIDTL